MPSFTVISVLCFIVTITKEATVHSIYIYIYIIIFFLYIWSENNSTTNDVGSVL